jgi:hypothetical protein
MAPQDLILATPIDGTPFAACQNSLLVAGPGKLHPQSPQNLTPSATHADKKIKPAISSVADFIDLYGSYSKAREMISLSYSVTIGARRRSAMSAFGAQYHNKWTKIPSIGPNITNNFPLITIVRCNDEMVDL